MNNKERGEGGEEREERGLLFMLRATPLFPRCWAPVIETSRHLRALLGCDWAPTLGVLKRG